MHCQMDKTYIFATCILLFAFSFMVPQSMKCDDCLYSNLDGKKGNELLVALQKDIQSHTKLTYMQVWSYNTNIDVINGLYVMDMYSDCKNMSSQAHCGSSNYDSSAPCGCYSREHSLPKSYWGSTGNSDTTAMFTDAVHVIPVDNATNEKRSAWAYGEVKTVEWSNSVGTKLGSNGSYKVFEPQDAYKGDLARIYFYMLTCYRDRNFTVGGQGYRVFDYSNGVTTFKSAFLNILLKWHRNDPVSEWEQLRNKRIQKKQGNRNPFVDNPELVEYIWGNKKSEVYHCGSTALNENADSPTPQFTKYLKDGHLYIIINGQTYNIQGQPVPAL